MPPTCRYGQLYILGVSLQTPNNQIQQVGLVEHRERLAAALTVHNMIDRHYIHTELPQQRLSGGAKTKLQEAQQSTEPSTPSGPISEDSHNVTTRRWNNLIITMLPQPGLRDSLHN